MCQLEGRLLQMDREDVWVWNEEETQVYIVKSTYKKLCTINAGGEGNISYFLEYKSFTNYPTLHLHIFINKVVTHDNLWKRGVVMGSNYVSCAKRIRK